LSSARSRPGARPSSLTSSVSVATGPANPSSSAVARWGSVLKSTRTRRRSGHRGYPRMTPECLGLLRAEVLQPCGTPPSRSALSRPRGGGGPVVSGASPCPRGRRRASSPRLDDNLLVVNRATSGRASCPPRGSCPGRVPRRARPPLGEPSKRHDDSPACAKRRCCRAGVPSKSAAIGTPNAGRDLAERVQRGRQAPRLDLRDHARGQAAFSASWRSAARAPARRC